MSPHHTIQLQKAYATGQAEALKAGFVPGREQSATVEKKLNVLLAVTGGMLTLAVTAVTVVGFWIA